MASRSRPTPLERFPAAAFQRSRNSGVAGNSRRPGTVSRSIRLSERWLEMSNSRRETIAGAVELDAEGVGLPGREDVDDAAAPGVLAGRGDEVLAGVAVAAEGFEKGVVVGLPAHFEGQEQAGEVLGAGHGLEQAAEAGDDQGGRRGEQPAEEPHPRRRGVEGRRDLEVGIVGEGSEGGRTGLRSEAGEEEAAVPLEGGQRGGFGADEDDRPAGCFGQAGEKVGLGGFDHAVDGERPFRRGDGADELAELRRAKEEVEAHRAILTAAPDAVKPCKKGPGLRKRQFSPGTAKTRSHLTRDFRHDTGI